MSEEKPNGKRANGGLSNRQAFGVAILSAILGSTGGPLLVSNVLGFNPYRPDPFTAQDGRIHDSRIQRLEEHVKNHPDQTKQFERRIIELEIRLQVIIDNQQRILERLSK